jgi:hypothetical protein
MASTNRRNAGPTSGAVSLGRAVAAVSGVVFRPDNDGRSIAEFSA